MSTSCSLITGCPVLVTAGVPSLTQRQPQGRWSWHGGSGFVWHGVIVTSATWLANLLHLRPHSRPSPGSVPTEVDWNLNNTNTIFSIIFDHTTTTCDDKLPSETTREEWSNSGLAVAEAHISSVCVLRNVYRCLERHVHSLRQWRCEKQRLSTADVRQEGEGGGGGGGGGEGEGGEFVSMESLLLPLSCVVFLKVKGLTNPPTSLPMCSCFAYSSSSLSQYLSRWVYRPHVGDPLVAVSTPFTTYCPEIFHNVMTSGCVCKLIGQNGAVFLTDACHLPGSEGAGLRRQRSTDVVAMVMAPLCSEKGYPTGLSLATPLSSLPPPQTPHPLPSPDSPLSSLPPPQTHHPPPSPHPDVPPHMTPPLQQNKLSGVRRLVVAVATGSSWGSGMLISSDRVLTCAHVAKPQSGTNSVSVYLPWSHSQPHSGSILEWNRDMDLAIIGLRHRISERPILELIQDTFHQKPHKTKPRGCQGSPVYAIGYETAPWYGCGQWPLVTEGVVSKCVGWEDGESVMMVTSAVVLPGMSGGLIMSDGRILGIIMSISEDKTLGHTYPNVNYSLLLPWLLPTLQAYILTDDRCRLNQFLVVNGERVRQLWSLSTLLRSSKL